jgi:hypothetical protein
MCALDEAPNASLAFQHFRAHLDMVLHIRRAVG